MVVRRTLSRALATLLLALVLDPMSGGSVSSRMMLLDPAFLPVTTLVDNDRGELRVDAAISES